MSFEQDTTRKITDIEQELSRLRSFESPQTVPKTNYNAVSDPTVNDDAVDGYSEGSRWVNTTTNVLFECVDATAGAAIWIPIPKVNYNATTAPASTDDVDGSYRVGSRWIDTTNDRLYECVDNTNNAAVWLPVWPSFGDICADFANLAGCRGCWTMAQFGSTGNVFDWTNNNSGVGQTLTYNGNPTFNRTSKGVAYIDFDGTGDYLLVADNSGLKILGTETYVNTGVRGFTFAGWVRPGSVSGTPVIFSKRGAAGQFSWNIAISGGNYIFTITNDGSTAVTVTGAAATVNVWTFLAGIFIPSSKLVIQVDDAQVENTIGIPASIFDSTAGFEVSGINAGASNLFTGRVSVCSMAAEANDQDYLKWLNHRSRHLFK